MEAKNNIIVYSVFSGTVYEIPERDANLLDIGQIPLKKYPNPKCNKCFGRGYSGRDTQTYAYMPCSCVHKVVDFSKKNVALPEKE